MGESKCLRETKGRRHPDVDPKVISQLRKFFAEHNQRFYELVGEDLGKLRGKKCDRDLYYGD